MGITINDIPRLLFAVYLMSISGGAECAMQGGFDVPEAAILKYPDIVRMLINDKTIDRGEKERWLGNIGNLNEEQADTFRSILLETAFADPKPTVVERDPAEELQKAASELLNTYGEPMLKCLHPTGRYYSTRLLATTRNGDNVRIKGKINWGGGFTNNSYQSIVELTVTKDNYSRMRLISENSSIPGGMTCALGKGWVPLSDYGSYAVRSGNALLLGAGIAGAAAVAASSTSSANENKYNSSAGASETAPSSCSHVYIGKVYKVKPKIYVMFTKDVEHDFRVQGFSAATGHVTVVRDDGKIIDTSCSEIPVGAVRDKNRE